MRRPGARGIAAVAGFGVVVISGAALGGMYLYQESIPTLVTLGLRDGQVEVGVQEQLPLSASRPVAPASMRAALKLSPAADGELRTSADGRHFSWRASKPLADLTRYTLSLSPLRDASGHAVKGARWRFTTTIVPRVVALTTEGGAPVLDQDAIPAGSRLRVSFNDAMDTATVKLLANGTPVGLSWAGDGRSASLEAGPLKVGTLQLALADGSRDVAGRAAMSWKIRASVVFEASIHTVPLRAPALVQVANDPAARDQSGLQAADAVYEYDTEGDITRLTAVFSRAPDEVGPVRSGRLISFALSRHLRGMLFMSGLSEGSRARLAAEPVPHAEDLVPGIFHRTGNRRAPDNLFITGASLQQNLERSGPPASSLQHGAVPISGGGDATSVSVPEHRSTYRYDAETATYAKSEDGHQLSDAELRQPLRITLLVVLHTTATNTNYVEDVNGVHGLDFDLESGGRADFYYGGHHAAGKWSAADRQSPLTFQLDNGAAVKLPPGLAWIDVVRT
jgi:hypothetical protein